MDSTQFTKTAPEPAQSEMELLPGEVIGRVCEFLEGIDVVRLSKTCRHLHQVLNDEYVWHSMTKERFGEAKLHEGMDNDADPKQWYFHCERLSKRLKAEELKITWNNGSYWTLLTDEESESKKIAKLHSVCWLDVRGELLGVRSGTYDCIWRVRLHRVTMDDGTRFHVETSVSERCVPAEMSLNRQDFARLEGQNRSWFDLNVGQITVKGTSTVKARIENHSNVWKHGIEIDYFELRRVYDGPRAGANAAVGGGEDVDMADGDQDAHYTTYTSSDPSCSVM
eukprot:comp6170_c0_seq1/m.1995 comp6170_c0_seq1/g.1995  ORF comp6170_c0_seq1/g.1995 comp6170_c0_seq1/m.1995 type:complete len:281 (-) comp6170_c0_seq1:617-1459(-)